MEEKVQNIQLQQEINNYKVGSVSWRRFVVWLID